MIDSRLITGVLVLCLASSITMAGETPKTVEERAKEMVIPRIQMEDLPIKDAVERLRVYSRALDPGGSGINIVFLPPKPKNGARYVALGETSGITVTMEFWNIPMNEAIRYMCAATQLNWQADPHAYVIYADESYVPDMSLRFYDLPTGVFYYGSNRRHPSDMYDPNDLNDDDIKTMFEDMGILFRSQAWIQFDVANERLIAFNEPRELRRIGKILDEIIRQPSKITLAAMVIDVKLLSDAETATASTVTFADILALPAANRRLLYRVSQFLPSDTDVAFRDLQASTIDGEVGTLSHDATVKMAIRDDNYTMDIALDWKQRFTAPDNEGEEWQAASVTTSLLLYDQEPAVYPLQTRSKDGATRRLFLILYPEIIRIHGRPLRQRETIEAETAP